ncbi:MAG: phenylalanine--tRNA ligase subunit alpha [Rhodospirillaceae bacterium]|nr:phenylalanine--tRNA ligase subunit alpha [Rhodospirillaceae bacterium]OUT76206.1 MAG: phenylalanine--tRNA ligase subunit alpha [Rhodospirillaceae bacterium TMED23]|tara:strand:+ start:144 stop:1223 length:1080 start_codon:yes stop_codon:yes gene_type:complete
MIDNIIVIKSEFSNLINDAENLEVLEEVRIAALGKKGRITSLMKNLGQMKPEERKSMGQNLNILKQEITNLLEIRKVELETTSLNARLHKERVDVTLPTRPEELGTIHPISQTTDELISIFGEMGFSVAEGPNIEEDWYNFTALNIPIDHPARQEHDTFYINAEKDGQRMVLRTHTSPVQIRTMQKHEPPIRIIVPGRTYRCDHDATHSPMFHQIEGLVIDETTHMGHLKGCLIEMCRTFFGIENLPVRFRPSYFPFTEPSAEVDIGCSFGNGILKIGEGDDWLEILGSGMVNPRVLENCGIDSQKFQGFAFGMGVERMAMLKYGIPDLRTFYDSDMRWLKHYGFQPFDIPSLVGRASL